MPPVRVDGVGFGAVTVRAVAPDRLPIGTGPVGMRTRMPPVRSAPIQTLWFDVDFHQVSRWLNHGKKWLEAGIAPRPSEGAS